MKLALGTVQFGLAYGVANSTGQVSTSEVRKILRAAAEVGVDTLDTAIAYGESESCLGEIGVSDWKVISKLPGLPADVDVYSWVQEQVEASLSRLGLQSLDGLLLHRPRDIIGPHSGDYISALLKLRDEGLTKAIGLSIYSPDDLDLIVPIFQPDLVQAPFNVFDRRIVNSGWLNRLNQKGVRVHTRSAFLQGLLLMTAARRPPWFEPWRRQLDRWDRSCKEVGLSPLSVALGFVLGRTEIERVIVGVDSADQFNQLKDAQAISSALPDLELSDLNLIDPSRWRFR